MAKTLSPDSDPFVNGQVQPNKHIFAPQLVNKLLLCIVLQSGVLDNHFVSASGLQGLDAG